MSNILKTYIKEVGQYPLLTGAQELELAYAYKNGDAEAREKLINSNLRLVINIAKNYKNAKLSLADLISEGNAGLIEAVERYNPDLGYRFSTCATPWIKQAILKAITDKGRTVRLPAHMFQLLSKYKRIVADFQQRGEEITDSKLAAVLNIDENKVRQLRNIKHDTISLMTPLDKEDGDTIEDLTPDQNNESPQQYTEREKRRELLLEAISKLKKRTQTIVKMRYGMGEPGVDPQELCEEHTLEEVGAYINLTRERVRQIEKQAINDLRALLADKKDVLMEEN